MTAHPVHRPPLVHIPHCPSATDPVNNENTNDLNINNNDNDSLMKATAHVTKKKKHSSNVFKQIYSSVLKEIPTAAYNMKVKQEEFQQAIPNTVFLLDWDDTCCSTTYLEWYGIMADLDTKLIPQVEQQLKILEQRVLQLLKQSIKLGTVLIVTNAGDGWVELSSSRFLPSVRRFIDMHYNQIKIISARSRYIDTYKQFPWRWKALTFNDILSSILLDNNYLPYQLNVIVLGDSPGDRYAAYDSSNCLSKIGLPITLKIVKFLERPTIDQLCKELAVLLDHLIVMTKHRGSFEVSMSNEQQQQHQQQQQSEHCGSSAPDGINAHDLAYHPYSSNNNSAVNSANVVDTVTSAAETSQLASTLTCVPPCAAAAV